MQIVREHNLTDEFVIDYLKTVDGKFSHNKYHALKRRVEANTASEFEIEFLQYFTDRFKDSLTARETFYRLLNNVIIRPVCEQCGKPVKFSNSSNEQLFQRFCSRKCAANNELTKNRLHETNLEKYGVPISSQAKVVKDNAKQHFNKVFGVNNPWQAKIVKSKSKATKLLKYGDENFNNREKSQLTCLAKYGGTSNMHCHDIVVKNRQRYVFNNLSFDSVPEIAFYIWLTDNQITFTYQPNVKFAYSVNDTLHFYYPDFLVDGQYIEIKGDHFFKDGKMICPYRDAKWTDDDYQKMCDRYEAKHQCMLANKVKILTKNEYIIYVDYVANLYGSNYLDTFKKDDK